jgi:hypothetical protein
MTIDTSTQNLESMLIMIKYKLLVKEEEPQPTMKSKFNEPSLNEREIVGYG